MDTCHASKQSSHAADSTGTVVSCQLTNAVYQLNTMDNLAVMSQLFHTLAESHGQASMYVEEKVSPTASIHRPQVQTRQWVFPFQDSLAGLGHGHPIWEPGHSMVFCNTMVSRETSQIDKIKPAVMLTPPLNLGGIIQ